MTDILQDRSLLHQARGHAGLPQQAAVQDFEGRTTRQDAMHRFVDRRHPTAADLLDDPIRAHQ
jgi:hypothetical protein